MATKVSKCPHHSSPFNSNPIGCMPEITNILLLKYLGFLTTSNKCYQLMALIG